MLSRAESLRDGLRRLGTSPTDRPDERLRKNGLVLTCVLIAALATLWTGTYFLLGRPLSAAVPLAYQLIALVGVILLWRTGNFIAFALTQLAAMLVLPFVLQWTLGGFVNSSAMMIWALTAPLAALVILGPRPALLLFNVYLVLTIVSGVMDADLASLVTPLSAQLQRLFFVLNIGAVSIVVFAVLRYFVDARQRAQAETDRLLDNILPAQVADRLRTGEHRIADDYQAVTVLFADLVGFTTLASQSSAAQLVDVLEPMFTAFDALADRCGLEKIKTIGDAYMAVAGVPVPRPDHVAAAADMALALVAETSRVAAAAKQPLTIRVGVHTGPAMAGVIGRRKFFYDVWGDAVNVASRMESLGVPGRIQVSEAVQSALGPNYRFEERGLIDVKGIGEMRTYFLLGRSQ